MYIKLDAREPHVLFNNLDQSFPGCCSKSNLDLGDFQFWNNENLVVIVERKTISDLISSIIDGRHREQKQRLLSNFETSKILYIIEGDDIISKQRQQQRVNAQSVCSAVLNTMFRDDIRVFRTKNINETEFVLSTIANKIIKKSWLNEQPDNHQNELVLQLACNAKKKENVSNTTIFRAMLCCIPGISSVTSERIIKEYPTLSSLNKLIELYNEDIGEIQSCMAKKMERKISSKVISHIINLLK